MRTISLEELKQIELNILVDVAHFCENNNLTYYMIGGTLLGAVRHKGFIPWDDDIDIVMPRDSYERFISSYNGFNDKYSVLSYAHTPNYYYPFAKAIDTRTILREKTDDPIDMGVYIDVFPIDYISDDYSKACRINKRIRFYRKILYAKNNHFHKKRKWYRNALSTIVSCVPISKLDLIKKIDFLAQAQNSNLSTKYSGALVVMTYEEREIIETSWYGEPVKLEFEGHFFNAPHDYDKILTSFYGCYMELPPEEEQISHHDFTAWYKE